MLSVAEIPEIFSDLTPIPQNDGPDRVCVIQYPSSFVLAYNYMRAVWAGKERSGKFYLLPIVSLLRKYFRSRMFWALNRTIIRTELYCFLTNYT